mgnify:CR=1 FL=1
MITNEWDRLRIQLVLTLEKIKNKNSTSSEKEITFYIRKYESAIELVDSNIGKVQIIASLESLLGYARGYLETSSDYTQVFLEEMSKTEKLIRILNEKILHPKI